MVFRWIEQNEHFREQYARAREIQLELISDEIIEIADTSRIGERRRSGFGPQGAISEVTTVDVVERSKLQVDARKWVLARLMPKKYGDKPQEKTSKANEQMQALRDILIAGPVEETPDTEPES